MNSKYKGYFKKHYKVNYDSSDFDNFKKWFYPQWQLINKTVKLPKKQIILEIGSGYGGLYSLIESTNPVSYVGLELDSNACKNSNEHFGVNSFMNKSLERYNNKYKFTTIYAFEVLEHLTDPSAGIEKIYKMLQKKGYFVGTSPYPYKKNVLADDTHKYVLHPVNWKKLFILAGFTSIQLIPMSFAPVIWRFSKRLNFRIPFYIPFKNVISTCLIIARK